MNDKGKTVDDRKARKAERSCIRVATDDDRDKQVIANIKRGYRLQRFVNACGGRASQRRTLAGLGVTASQPLLRTHR
jgi:hypothetical protein